MLRRTLRTYASSAVILISSDGRARVCLGRDSEISVRAATRSGAVRQNRDSDHRRDGAVRRHRGNRVWSVDSDRCWHAPGGDSASHRHVAILSTKVPILLGHGFWGFRLPKLESYGWWSMRHEARTDMSMWLALVFLLAVGAGTLSVDARLTAPDDMTLGRRR